MFSRREATEDEGEGRQEQVSAVAVGVAIGGPWRGRRGAASRRAAAWGLAAADKAAARHGLSFACSPSCSAALPRVAWPNGLFFAGKWTQRYFLVGVLSSQPNFPFSS